MCYFILSVTPQYLWTVQKISDSRIHGSNPIAAHGNVKAEDGGLQLNGVDAWLDAGDFYGQCLGDPDLCIKGLSFALQVQHLTLIPKFLQAFSFVSRLMLPFMDWEMLRLGWSVHVAMCNMPFHNGGLLICCFICMIISISVFVGVCKIQFLLPNRKVHLYTYERKNKWLAIMKEVYLINRAIFRALIGRELLSRRLWTIEMIRWRKWKWKWSSKTVNVIAKKTIEQQFSWSILLPTTGMKSKCWPAVRRFTWGANILTSFYGRNKCRPWKIVFNVLCKTFSCQNCFVLHESEKLFSQQASHLASFWKGSLKVNFLVLYYSWSGLWTRIVIGESQSVIDSYSTWLLRKHRSG